MENVRELGRQPALDGVRGLAVLLVVSFHVGLPLPMGGIGVDVFFVLSGFLITAMLLSERERTGTISLRRFYARRARRLLPALLLVLAAFAVLHYFGYFDLGMRLRYALLFPLFFATDFLALVHGMPPLGVLTPTWSLAVEEQFYLLWPIVLFLAVRRGVLPRVMIALIVVAGCGLAYFAHLIPWRYPHWSIYFNPFDRGAEILLGCAAAFLYRYRLVPRILRWRPLGWLALAGLLFEAHKEKITIGDSFPVAPWTNYQIGYFAAAGLTFLMVISLLENVDGDLGAFFMLGPLRFLGRISYGLYLIHLPVVDLVRRHGLSHLTDLIRGPIAALIAIALASASWYLLESPILRRGRRSKVRPNSSVGPDPSVPVAAAPSPGPVPVPRTAQAATVAASSTATSSSGSE